MRPRSPNILARLAHPSHRPAAQAGANGTGSPRMQAIERNVTQWKQEALAKLPRVPAAGINYADGKGNDTRPQHIESVAAAVLSAAATNEPKLRIQYLPASSLPPAIGRLTALRELDLSFNPELTRLSEHDIAPLKELTRLSVQGSPLESLPTALGGLPKLATLSLSGGSYEALPLGFTRLRGSLQDLEISNSRPAPGGGGGLKKLPADLGSLSLLQNLKLSGHQELEEIPASVGNLTQLRTLDLSRCPKVKALPDLSNLRHLQTLNLSGCSGLIERPVWLSQLPRSCKVILPEHLSARRPGPSDNPRPDRLQPRSPEETAQRGQQLGDWVTKLQPFMGERGAGRFNLWMGAMVRRQGDGPDAMGQLDAVVKAATASPAFRAELFAFAADSVKIPRDAAGRQQQGPVAAGTTDVGDAHRLLVNHRIAHPQTNPRQAYALLRQQATDPVNTSLFNELLAFTSPRNARAGSAQAQVPKLLESYVKTHDKEGQAIMETLRSLEGRRGRGSADEAAAHAAAVQPLEELLRARCLAVARQLQHFG